MIDVRLLHEPARLRKYPNGQRIAGGEAAEMYVVVSGNVEAYAVGSNKVTLTSTLGPGESFGAVEFFWGGSFNAYRARGETTVYVISEATFYELAKTKAQVLYELMKTLCAPEGGVMAAPVKPAAAGQTATAQPKPSPAVAAPTPQWAPLVQKEAGSSITAVSAGFFPEGHKNYPGIAKPEYAKYVYDKEYKCPNCTKAFQSSRIYQSKLVSSAPIRFDMREYFVDFQIEWYDVITCPHCYFSMLSAYFVDPKNFFRLRATEALKGVQDRIALNFNAERDLDMVLASHYLALISAVGFVNQRQIKAKLWSNISWLYEDAQDEDMAKYASGQAAQAYEALFMETTMNPGQEQVVCLSVAGMLYRAGENADIKKWLYQVKTNRSGKKMYADLADDLLEMVKK